MRSAFPTVRRSRTISYAVLAASTTMLAGCGEDSSSSEASSSGDTQSLKAFRAAAAEPCETAAAALVKIEKPSSYPIDLAEYGDAGTAVLDAAKEPFEELRGLDAPDGHVDEFEAFTAALDNTEAAAEQMVSLVEDENDDPDAHWYARTQVETELHRASIEAEALGVAECGELGFAASEGHHG